MTKVVYEISHVGGDDRVLATFRMAGDRLVATYEDEGYKRLVEGVGFMIVVDGEDRSITTKDGRLFFDNLERFHWQSSTTFVRSE